MIVRIVSPGWENFTGSMGHQAVFKDGVSVGPLNARQVARIGSSLQIVDDETGEQVGPSVVHKNLQMQSATVTPALATKTETDEQEAVDCARLIAEEKARKEAEALALAAAQRKAQEQVEAQVIYSRVELEAIASNDGINGLREIANPLGVSARRIDEMVTRILEAQAKLTVAQ